MKVRTLDVPLPSVETLEARLAARLGSKSAAERAILQVAGELGIPEGAPRSVSAALALTKMGDDPGRIASSLEWSEFEQYCAMAVSAAGYTVRRNVRMLKPTRQIDIVAESPSLVLSIDCKHWKRSGGAGLLAAPAAAQLERTRMFAKAMRPGEERPLLPVLLTLLDNRVRLLGGVPVVPLQALREFLASVSRFDDGLAFVTA